MMVNAPPAFAIITYSQTYQLCFPPSNVGMQEWQMLSRLNKKSE